jgi:hypothetical protein
MERCDLRSELEFVAFFNASQLVFSFISNFVFMKNHEENNKKNNRNVNRCLHPQSIPNTLHRLNQLLIQLLSQVGYIYIQFPITLLIPDSRITPYLIDDSRSLDGASFSSEQTS